MDGWMVGCQPNSVGSVLPFPLCSIPSAFICKRFEIIFLSLSPSQSFLSSLLLLLLLRCCSSCFSGFFLYCIERTSERTKEAERTKQNVIKQLQMFIRWQENWKNLVAQQQLFFRHPSIHLGRAGSGRVGRCPVLIILELERGICQVKEIDSSIT